MQNNHYLTGKTEGLCKDGVSKYSKTSVCKGEFNLLAKVQEKSLQAALNYTM